MLYCGLGLGIALLIWSYMIRSLVRFRISLRFRDHYSQDRFRATAGEMFRTRIRHRDIVRVRFGV